MLALTLKHPWVWAVKVLGKRIENRSWHPGPRLPIGTRFAIHGGKVPAKKADVLEIACEAQILARLYTALAPATLTPRDVILPGIVAVVRFDGVVKESDDPWFQGPYGWQFSDVVVLPEAVPCRGAQGLWEIPEDVLEVVRLQYQTAKELTLEVPV